jgi:hypothetical protein
MPSYASAAAARLGHVPLWECVRVSGVSTP